MPEGPSMIILKDALQKFKSKRILNAKGNTKKIDVERLKNQTIIEFKTWGKHFLIRFRKFTLRVHFLLFGSYRIDDPSGTPRLSLQLKNGNISFYACSLKIVEEPLDEVYDWSADVMSDVWSPQKAIKKLKAHPDMLVCDALLNQDIFAGSGNIIKCEVLFRTRIHPASRIGSLPLKKLRELVKETRNYSFDFLRWKREYMLRKNWEIYTKRKCPRCNIPSIKETMGKTKRRTFYCHNCQLLYDVDKQ